MKVKTTVVALALALGAAAAHAATYDLKTLSIGDNYLSGSETSTVSVGKGSFSDVFNFSLSGINNVDVSAGVLNFGKFKIADTSFSYTLFDSQNNSVATGANDSGFTLAGLAAGAYHLDVSGLAAGTNGGQYNGVLSVAAIPEPESYAMFLAGLGLMGVIARRRRVS